MDLDSPNTDSLFDFLYVDRSRLAALSAQLFSRGVLQSTKTTDSTTGKAGGALDVGVPKVLGLSASGLNETLSAIEQQFDASWSLPLNVMDRLDEQGFIVPDIRQARLGDIFHAKGKLRFLDYRMLKDCWEQIAPITIGAQAQQGKAMKQAEKENLKNLFKIMQKLPHSIELIIHSESGMIWTCPDAKSLTIESSSLTFTHGSSIPGTWGILALLDGFPARTGDDFTVDLIADMTEKPMVKDLQLALSQIADGLRSMLGRPHVAYAATPLVIFRKIEPRAQQMMLPVDS